jgi:hypothetical protein
VRVHFNKWAIGGIIEGQEKRGGQRDEEDKEMRKSHSEVKGSLMKEAEAVIDELLTWEEQAEAPDLSQIEGVVLKLRQRLSEKMAEVVIQQQENVVPVPGPMCAQCGQEMRYKGLHSKEVSSWVGEIELKRGYYHCQKCKTGLFPPG